LCNIAETDGRRPINSTSRRRRRRRFRLLVTEPDYVLSGGLRPAVRSQETKLGLAQAMCQSISRSLATAWAGPVLGPWLTAMTASASAAVKLGGSGWA